MARQWFVEGVQFVENGTEEWFVGGVQIAEDQGAAAGQLMGAIAGQGGLAGPGGIAGPHGGLAG